MQVKKERKSVPTTPICILVSFITSKELKAKEIEVTVKRLLQMTNKNYHSNHVIEE